jgi:hypothetical protein
MISGLDSWRATVIQAIQDAGEPKAQVERMALDGLK